MEFIEPLVKYLNNCKRIAEETMAALPKKSHLYQYAKGHYDAHNELLGALEKAGLVEAREKNDKRPQT